jgi:hypothetical protein
MVVVTLPTDPPAGTVKLDCDSVIESLSLLGGGFVDPDPPLELLLEPQPASAIVKAQTQTYGRIS